MEICKSCGGRITHKYCPHCGERLSRRITARTAFDDLLRGFTNGDRGVFLTLKELVTRPGHMITEYLDGRRVNHFRPLPLLILLVGVLTLFDRWFNIDTDAHQGYIEENLFDTSPIKAMMMIPLYALVAWLLFRRRGSGYNYVEHIYILVFVQIQSQLLTFITFSVPMALLGDSVSGITKLVLVLVAGSVILAVTVWDYMQIFKFGVWASLWRSFSIYISAWIIFILLTIAIGLLIVEFFVI